MKSNFLKIIIILFFVISFTSFAASQIIFVDNIPSSLNSEVTNLTESQINNVAEPVKKLSKPFSGRIIEKQISAEEFYKNRTHSGEIGLPGYANIEQPLKGAAFNNYFREQNLADDYYYVFIQFDTLDGDPTQNQTDILTKDGVALFDWHGYHTYIARAPTSFLLNKNYDFIRWMGLIDHIDAKIGIPSNERVSGNEIPVTVIFYEPLTDENTALEIESMAKINKWDTLRNSELVNLEIKPENLYKLASLKQVKYIEPNPLVTLTVDKSSSVVDTVRGEGANAYGITVGIIDTGIQHNHPYFGGVHIFNASDYADNDQNPEAICGESNCSDGINNDGNSGKDEGTHGVHVAGIISGLGITYQGRNLRGISDRASLVIQRVFNAEGVWVAPDENQPDIWRNITDPDGDGNVYEESSADIISNSWGNANSSIDGKYTSSSEQVDKTVLGWNGKPIVVVFAAGNDKTSLSPWVNPPATAKNAITVGASADYYSANTYCQHQNPNATYDQNNLYVMDYSSRMTADGRVKPDILAPGSDITSPVLGSAYISWDGTSMAAPHLSAVAAQIIGEYNNASYNISPTTVKAFLLGQTVGGGTTDSKDYDEVWGRLDSRRAVFQTDDEYLDEFAEGTVGEPGSGQSISRGYVIPVPTGTLELIVTLVWNDIPGEKNTSNSLYNELDLMIDNTTGQTVLSSSGDDTKNNVEKYRVKKPEAGDWTAWVSAIDLNGSAGIQNYSIKFNIIKSLGTPDMYMNIYKSASMIKPGANVSIYANPVYVDGVEAYDLRATINFSSGTTNVTSPLDGTDSNKDVIGDIRPGGSRVSRTWYIRGDTIGIKNVTINVTGKKINGSDWTAGVKTTFTVCYDDDGDGYFATSCGGDDCNDNSNLSHPGGNESLYCSDGLDNDCNGLTDEADPVCQPKVLIQNSLGTNVASLNYYGNITLKGACTSTGACNPTANSFIIRNSTDGTVAYINETGDMCISVGTCAGGSATCNPSNDAFIIQDSTGKNVSYIDKTGDLCLIGTLTQNGSP